MKFYKPRFWDYKEFTIWPYLLFPLTIFINLTNLLKFKYVKAKKFNVPIISVGNIYLGGTGKTPLCIEIFKIFKSLNLKPAFVKKNYEKYADEKKLLEKFGKVFTGSKRSQAINLLVNNKFQVAILDDGFQDPSIKSDISIICFNEELWIGNGFVIPAGPLREKLTALKRCDFVFMNGKYNLNLEKTISNFNPKIKIFYSQYNITNLNDIKDKKVIAFAGIGNPKSFFDLLKEKNIEVIESFIFPDHYSFEKEDIIKLNKKAIELNASLVTTEKNYVALKEEDKKNIHCLKIELLVDKKEEFINSLKKVI